MLKRNLLGLSFFALLQAAPALARDKPDPAAQAKPAVAQSTLNDARRTLDSWRQEYNCERPHSSLRI
jgi:transposase InsO family protein